MTEHSPRETDNSLSRRQFLIGAAGLAFGLSASRLLKPDEAMATTEAESSKEIDLLRYGKWAVPGVLHEADGLRVQSIDYSIFNKNRGDYQEAKPVNLFGTHLKTTGDFEIIIDMHDLEGEAGVALYGRPPIVFDDFRYETPSVRAALQNDSLWVGVMDVKAQDYGNGHDFQVKPSMNARLVIERQAGHLVFELDGRKVGQVAESGTFDSGEVWFGLDSAQAKNGWLLAGIDARPLNSGHMELVDTSQIEVPKDPHGLNVLGQKKRPGFMIGTAISTAPLVSDQRYAELALNGNFGIFTPENAMKFQFIHPQPDVYTFQEADGLVKLAEAHGINLHGHTLDFAGALPKWVQTAPKHELHAILVDHIKTVVTHFGEAVRDWDVVNEPLADYDQPAGKYGLRENIWYDAMGPDHIAIALWTAHQANPKARLWINEFGMESDDDRFATMLSLLKRLKEQKVPVYGVGFQAHLDKSDTVNKDGKSINQAKLRSRAKALKKLGLHMRFSELDITNGVSQNIFSQVLEAAIEEPNCVDQTMWGITDKYGAGDTISDGRIQAYPGRPWDQNEQPLASVSGMRQDLS